MEPSRWQLLLDHLTTTMQVNGELIAYKNVRTNAGRVKLCSNNGLVTKKVEEWTKTCTQQHTSTNIKDGEKSLQLKLQGNKAYVAKHDDKALEFYNRALLMCPEDEISLVYGNRSAVLFNKSLWEECIVDVDLALAKGFPDEKSWKLYKRKGEALLKMDRIGDSVSCYEKCIDLLKSDEKLKKEKDSVTLLHAAARDTEPRCSSKHGNGMNIDENKCLPLHGFNDKVTCGSKAISLVENDDVGRHFIGNETIACGSIVIVEEPYASVLLPDWFHSHCQHCFSKATCPFPCQQCTDVCYCSIECQRDSWQSYHYFECGKLNLMKQIGVSHLALRIILMTDAKTLAMFFDDSPHSTCERDIKGCNDSGVYESNYESLYHLITHSEDLEVEDQFQYTVAASLLLNILCTNTYFPPDTNDETKFKLGGLLLRHIQQIVCNAHAITSIESTLNISENIVEQDQVRIATALYATSSILNHSCCPNILNTFHKNKLIVKVIKTINKGDPVYTCYGPHYRRMDFTERQSALKSQYCFSCTCECCSKGLRAMEEFDCFCCPECRRIFHREENNCVHCGTAVDLLFSEYERKSADAAELFSAGLEFMNDAQSKKASNNNTFKNKTINLALTKLLNCSKIQESIYFKFHSSLGKTYDAIAKCYAVLYLYSDSLSFIKRSLLLVEAHYGANSAELTNEYLKLCDVYFALMQNFIDTKDYTGVKRYHSDALGAVERCIKLLQLNKEPDSPDLFDLRCKHESLIKLAYMNTISG